MAVVHVEQSLEEVVLPALQAAFKPALGKVHSQGCFCLGSGLTAALQNKTDNVKTSPLTTLLMLSAACGESERGSVRICSASAHASATAGGTTA
jgi:hypothetical protein